VLEYFTHELKTMGVNPAVHCTLTVENISIVELQSIWRIVCSLAIQWNRISNDKSNLKNAELIKIFNSINFSYMNFSIYLKGYVSPINNLLVTRNLWLNLIC
jgi:hypothetical protein